MDLPKQRVKYRGCRVEETGDGSCHAVVVIDAGDESFTGTADRPAGVDADVWSAAAAMVDALRQVYELEDEALVLRDVTVFEIDDAPATATSLRATRDNTRLRLYGLCRTEENRRRAAALSVLNATNRFFGDT